MFGFLGRLTGLAAILAGVYAASPGAPDSLVCPSGYHKEWAKLCILKDTEHLRQQEPMDPIFDGTGYVYGDQPICHGQRSLVVISLCATDHGATD